MTLLLSRLKSLSLFMHRNARRHPVAVLMSVLCIAAVFAFANVASEVLEGETHEIDEALLLALRTPGDVTDPVGPRWVEEMMRDLTGLGGVAFLTLVTTFSAIYLAVIGRRARALYLVSAVVTGSVLSRLMKMGFDRPRPDLVPHGSIVYTASFPSGHSMISAITYLTLGALLAEAQGGYRLKAYILGTAIIMTLLIGVSRVYLGVHWPSDVLAGWLSGTAWALATWIVAEVIEARAGRKGF